MNGFDFKVRRKRVDEPDDVGGRSLEKWFTGGPDAGELAIFLVRHGETEHNRQGRLQGRGGVSLNEAGRAQAALLASWLGRVPLDAIYTSDIPRARETASIIAGFQRQCAVVELKELREWDFGEWEGKTHDEILAYDRERRETWLADPVNLPTPGGESLRDVRDRGIVAVQLIRERSRSGRVAAVTHGALLRAVIAAFAELPLEEALTLRLDLGSVSVLRFNKSRWSVEAVGFKPGVSVRPPAVPPTPVACQASFGGTPSDCSGECLGASVQKVLLGDKKSRCP